MNRRSTNEDRSMGCDACRDGLQEYLDGTLPKQESLKFFLHLRECDGCRLEHDKLHGLFHALESLPDIEVPTDFDAAVLASVPYAAYRAMEPLRRERVPVIFEEESLPVWIRSAGVRWSGLGVAVLATGGRLLDGPGLLSVVAIAALIPQVLVMVQGLGRRVVLGVRRAEG